LDGQIWALKADSLTSPLIVTVTVTVTVSVLCNSYGGTQRPPFSPNRVTKQQF